MGSLGCICVECGHAVPQLYKQYSEGNIRLARCDACGSVADKYIEYEFVLIAIDLVLHRAEAYRHLLFNRQPLCNHTQDARIWRLALGLVLLEAYLVSVAVAARSGS
ncbi:unnamed protein product, partial [Phaeothamnion confervicola]